MNETVPSLTSPWIVAARTFTKSHNLLRYAYHPPEEGTKPRGLLVFMNGHNDWIEKYDFLRELIGVPSEWGFLTWDHRGQGGSEGQRSDIESYDQFAQDTSAMIQSHYSGENILIISHSMGGLIALYTTLKEFIKPKALVLCSPLLALPNNPCPRWLYKPLSFLFEKTRYGHRQLFKFEHQPFETNEKTHSKEAYLRILNSPFSQHKPTFAWLKATFNAISTVHRHSLIKKVSCPILILTGSEESVVDPKGSTRWCQQARKLSANIVLKCIPGARHELLNEEARYRSLAISAIRNFLKPYF